MKSNRRKFIQTTGAAGAAGFTFGASALSVSSHTSSPGKEEEDGQIIFIGDNIAVADTSYGKVRGFIHKDIYNFLGIPYGANTAGKNRFMPPQKPDHYMVKVRRQDLRNFVRDSY